jgi:hypothetical protein
MVIGIIMSLIEKITAVAITDQNTGRVWSLPAPARHGDLVLLLKDYNIILTGSKMGFLTNLGRFVDRKEGWIVASKANQILSTSAPDGTVLVSEDLW